MNRQQPSSKVWYKEPWPWILMAGPVIVVIASTFSFFIAKENAADLVSDDYYKDGKHIDIQLHRDEEAFRRNINAQVLLSPAMDAAKVFVSGNFDPAVPISLKLMHPARKSADLTVRLTPSPAAANAQGSREYTASFKALPQANHWYVRVEDDAGKWRVEDKWIVSQGFALNLMPAKKLNSGSGAGQ